MKKQSSAAPHVVLVSSEPANSGGVVLRRIDDLPKLLEGRAQRLHGDVIDLLVDLVIETIDAGDGRAGTSH